MNKSQGLLMLTGETKGWKTASARALKLDCITVLFVTNGSTRVCLAFCLAGELWVTHRRMILCFFVAETCAPLGLRQKWNTAKRDAPAERVVKILQRAWFKRGSSGAKVENPKFSLFSPSWNVGSMNRHSKDNHELLISESPHVLCLQEARTTPHELRAMKHRFGEVGYFALWDARRQLASIARLGLNLCQCSLPTRLKKKRLKGPNLRRNWNVLTLPVASLILVKLSAGCTGDHVLMRM